jgi:hypothetical protein
MNTKDKIIWNNIEQLLDEKGWSLADSGLFYCL